jgi:predicted pyridoxine 5'-phosphate oxidase superfamily flavin-nucleotide-binding protein
MGKTHTTITPDTASWIANQKMFFVATAPLSRDGHVNLSPKGLNTFRIIDDKTVAYLDLTGSGVETIAHLHENARITVMFCAFDGPPKIVRLYGTGEVLRKDESKYNELSALFTPHDAARSIIVVHIHRVSHSCGYGVPLYEFKSERDHVDKWTAAKGVDGVAAYQKEKNAVSIDGLKAI